MTTNRARVDRLENAASKSADPEPTAHDTISAELARWNPWRFARFIQAAWRSHMLDVRPAEDDEGPHAPLWRAAWDYGWVYVLNSGLGVDELERLLIDQFGPEEPLPDAFELSPVHEQEGETR